MKAWPPFFCLLAMLSIAQANPDDLLRRECALRLQQYGLTLEPAKLSLAAFQEIEARLDLCFRLKAKVRQFYDYRTTSLAFLQDLEHRWDACERIQQNYNILLRHEYYTAPALADLEQRLGVASRIYQTYGRDVNWRDRSLRQLQTTEAQLAAVQAPLITPHTQPLAMNAVVFRSHTPTPAPPQVVMDSTVQTSSTAHSSNSYAYQTATYTPSYPTLLSTPVPPRSSRRVTSAPVFNNSGYNSYYGYGYNSGYCAPHYPMLNYCAPSVPSVPRVPSVPSVPCVPPLIRLW